MQGEESDDEVAFSGQHDNVTMEKGVVRALHSAPEVAGAERTGMQGVQVGQASVSGGGMF